MIYKESLNEIAAHAHDTAVAKGFYEDIEALCRRCAAFWRTAICRR